MLRGHRPRFCPATRGPMAGPELDDLLQDYRVCLDPVRRLSSPPSARASGTAESLGEVLRVCGPGDPRDVTLRYRSEGNGVAGRGANRRRGKTMEYDALLIVSFGGPEELQDVIPFLENVLRGKDVPRERMLQVAEHYYHFGGKSPINGQNRALIAALDGEGKGHGLSLPIYWGNRNWRPLLADTDRCMRTDGVRRALAFATSAFGSYSGC